MGRRRINPAMKIIVREFEETDREALRDLYVASRNAAFIWDCGKRHLQFDFDAHTEGEKVLVAVADEKIIGFASIWEPDSFLHNLFVHPSAMRQGVGKALLAHCAKYFCGKPRLKCLKANTNALAFYRSQGWSVLREELGPDGPYLLLERQATVKKTYDRQFGQ